MHTPMQRFSKKDSYAIRTSSPEKDASPASIPSYSLILTETTPTATFRCHSFPTITIPIHTHMFLLGRSDGCKKHKRKQNDVKEARRKHKAQHVDSLRCYRPDNLSNHFINTMKR